MYAKPKFQKKEFHKRKLAFKKQNRARRFQNKRKNMHPQCSSRMHCERCFCSLFSSSNLISISVMQPEFLIYSVHLLFLYFMHLILQHTRGKLSTYSPAPRGLPVCILAFDDGAQRTKFHPLSIWYQRAKKKKHEKKTRNNRTMKIINNVSAGTCYSVVVCGLY